MTESYNYHLNFEALRKSTDELERLLNKYRVENKYVEEAYQSLKPLFDQIHNNQLKKAIEGNLSVSRMLSESGLEDSYPDLRHAFSVFSLDIKGLTDHPDNNELDEKIRLALERARAKRDAQENDF